MIATALQTIRDSIARTAVAAGRDPATITLVAVTKTVQIPYLEQALDCGQTVFGENYLQEASAKIPGLRRVGISWHFLGHLQSNKARRAAELFDVIETVDRLKLAQVLDKQAAFLNKRLSVLVQVNIGKEPQKSGVLPENTEALLRAMQEARHLRASGLMALPPFSPDPEESRPYFRQLNRLAVTLAGKGLFADNDRVELSMGMSDDYTVAIEEGATIVRIGTAIFGARNPQLEKA